MAFTVKRATWPLFERAMGKKGGYGGCWCMLWRLPKKQMDAQMGEENRLAMKRVFDQGACPGLVATVDDGDGEKPIGWIQLADRREFTRLEASRVLKPVDDIPVWSVSCFYIHTSFRRKGLSVALLKAACEFASHGGATVLEGYPIDTPKKNYPAVYAWTGLYPTFLRAGFSEVARRSPTRPIMRRVLIG